MHYSFCKNCNALNRVNLDNSGREPICGKCQNDLMSVKQAIELDESSLFKLIKNSDLPVIVDVFASWCGPCQVYGPIFDEVSREEFEHYQFVKVDSEKAMQLAVQYGIRGIPATLIFKDNKLMKNESGLLQKSQLINLIAPLK